MNVVDMYMIVSIPIGWMFLSRLQSGFVIFASMERYFFMKLILSAMIDWLIAPFFVGYLIVKAVLGRKKKAGKAS